MNNIAEILDPLDQVLWGAREFAPVIRRSEPMTYKLLERGLLDATKIGPRSWTSTPRRLLTSIGAITKNDPPG